MTLKEAMMQKFDMLPHEAQQRIDEMVDEVVAGRNPEDVLLEEGFDADYVFDLLEHLYDA
jgi:hypothetical protein